MNSQSPALQVRADTLARERPQTHAPDSADSTRDYHPTTKGFNTMTERQSPHNRTTVPVLDRHGQPLAPARPSRVRQWLESGRAHKVWVKGIFAVQAQRPGRYNRHHRRLRVQPRPRRDHGHRHHSGIPRWQITHHRRRLRAPTPQPGNTPQPRQPPRLPAQPPQPPTTSARTVQQPSQRPHQGPAATQHGKPRACGQINTLHSNDRTPTFQQMFPMQLIIIS